MKVGDKVHFELDIEGYNGIIERIDDKTADVLTWIGLVTNVPISELKAANFYVWH